LGGDEVYVNTTKIKENLDGWFLLWQLQVNDEKLKGDISTLEKRGYFYFGLTPWSNYLTSRKKNAIFGCTII